MQSTEKSSQVLDSEVIKHLMSTGDLKCCVKQISRETLEDLFLDLLDHTIATNDWLKSIGSNDEQ